MTNQNQLDSIRVRDQYERLAPPPRLLLWIAAAILLLIVVGVIAALVLLQGRLSLSSLFQIGVLGAMVITAGSLAAAAITRRRRVLLGVMVALVVVWVVGGTVFVLLYRESFQPGQRETAKNALPFLRMFDPPLPPPDTTLPTVAPNESNGISPSDLLSAPLSLGAGESTAEVSPTQAPLPTATAPAAIQVEPSTTPSPTLPPTATLAATDVIPTEAALAPGQASAAQTAARPSSHWIYGFSYVKQTWNNCGPANITMALSYYGWKEPQEVAAAYLKPDREDKNVSPNEMVAFVNERSTVRALYRVGGDMELLKQFIANGFPVVVESVLDAEAYDWIGHYETVVGYDDSTGSFYIYDSYVGNGNGSGRADPYNEFDRAWQNFNRTFLVLYRQEEEARVREILGDLADPVAAAEQAAEVAQQEARENPNDAFAWFNLGSSLTRMGDYERAAAAYDQSRRIGTLPFRILLYQFGPFEAYFNVGRYDDVMALVNSNLNNGGEFVEETYYWQGQVLQAQGKVQEAGSAYRRALLHNPRFAAAKDALAKLPV